MASTPPDAATAALLERIAIALERLAPAPPTRPDFDAADAFVWSAAGTLTPVPRVNRVDVALLRGMGKSSLVKAAQAAVNAELSAGAARLKLVEIHREDIGGLPALMGLVRDSRHPFVLFCDDLSFDSDDTTYKSLKAVLEGGIEGRPANVLFYATSNRRHLMPRDMMDNERSTAINPGEAVEEKVSLSDRFGLWLGFHKCSQDEYLDMVQGYADHFGLGLDREALRPEALEWSATRASRSGRTAWQFIQDLAGRLDKPLPQT